MLIVELGNKRISQNNSKFVVRISNKMDQYNTSNCYYINKSHLYLSKNWKQVICMVSFKSV